MGYANCGARMAHGLGMNQEEWLELRKKIDDSFWVMRVIGGYKSLFLGIS